jgi:hypothetical protein
MMPSPVISPFAPEAMGGIPALGGVSLGSAATAAWPSANLLIGYPFRVCRSTTLTKLWLYKGGAIAGNLDLGIYDAAGTKIISTGSTAESAGTNQLQVIDITDTTLGEGDFYLCLTMDGTTGTTMRLTWTGSASPWALGQVHVASAFPLPATVAWAISDYHLPIFGALVWPRTVM